MYLNISKLHNIKIVLIPFVLTGLLTKANECLHTDLAKCRYCASTNRNDNFIALAGGSVAVLQWAVPGYIAEGLDAEEDEREKDEEEQSDEQVKDAAYQIMSNLPFPNMQISTVSAKYKACATLIGSWNQSPLCLAPCWTKIL